jgi:hypothetical protein
MEWNLAFLLRFLICYIVTASWTIPLNDSYLDFHDFERTIRSVISAREIAMPTNCSIPSKSLIVTCGNNYFFPLLLEQMKAMQTSGSPKCFAHLLVTLCMDVSCYRQCINNKLFNCALLGTENVIIPDSNWKERGYGYINYLKLIIQRVALSMVDSLFFIEADVSLYENPWEHYTFGDANASSTDHIDLMFQREVIGNRGRFLYGEAAANDVGCGEKSLNGGQLYFRKSDKTLKFLDALIENRLATIKNLALGKQYFIILQANQLGLNMCTLPASKFAGHCQLMKTYNVSIRETITYHAACSTTVSRKLAVLQKHLLCRTVCKSSFYLNTSDICNISSCALQ